MLFPRLGVPHRVSSAVASRHERTALDETNTFCQFNIVLILLLLLPSITFKHYFTHTNPIENVHGGCTFRSFKICAQLRGETEDGVSNPSKAKDTIAQPF